MFDLLKAYVYNSYIAYIDSSAISKMYSTVKPLDQRFKKHTTTKSVPLITTLLRASRNQDEELIKNVLQHIITEGISEEDLNATDASGRVSVIYIQIMYAMFVFYFYLTIE